MRWMRALRVLQGAVGARENQLRSHRVRTRLRAGACARTHLCLVVIVRLRVRLRRTGHTLEVDVAGPRDKLVQQRQCFVPAPCTRGAMKHTAIGGLDAPAGTPQGVRLGSAIDHTRW